MLIHVSPQDVQRTLPTWFHGINIMGNVWDLYATTARSQTALANGGFAGVRFPGGIPSDGYWWDCPYWTPNDPYADPLNPGPVVCPPGVRDIINGAVNNSNYPLSGFYETGLSFFDSSALPSGPDREAERFLALFANWSGESYSVGRTRPEDIYALSQHIAGSDRRLLLQSNVFGTVHSQIAPNPPLDRSPNASYAAAWAGDVYSRGIPADFEVGNEPEHFVIGDAQSSDPWRWTREYISEFKLHASAIRQANPAARIFGPATNIGWSGLLDDPHVNRPIIDWGCQAGQDLRSRECGRLSDTRELKQSDGLPLGFRGTYDGGLDELPDTIGWRVLDNWLRLTAQAPSDQQPDGVSIHYYPEHAACDHWPDRPSGACGNSRTWAVQRSVAQSFRYHYERVQELVRHWYQRDLPIIVSEWHVGHMHPASNEVPGQNASVGAALQQLDTVATFAQLGVESHLFHSLHDVGPGKATAWGFEGYGALYGLLTGFIDQHKTHMTRGPRHPDEATASFYAMALWGARMGDRVLYPPTRNGDYASQPDRVSTYATKDAQGNIQVLVINKTDEILDLRVVFTDTFYQEYPSAHVTWLSAGALTTEGSILEDEQPYLNGVAWPVSDLFLPDPEIQWSVDGLGVDRAIAPFSAVVMEFDPQARDVPPPGDLPPPEDCHPRDGICPEQ